jgi:hypothetical protein
VTSVASPSITVARFLIHCSSVIGLSEITVLAGDMLQMPGVAPVRRVAVLQPEYLRRNVGRNVLDVGRIHELAARF